MFLNIQNMLYKTVDMQNAIKIKKISVTVVYSIYKLYICVKF
jgi:hypothetical protein